MSAVTPHERSIVVAIDGPSGSGKSSVSREAARRLALEYLDTGAMYRAVCWACLDRGVDLLDEPAVADLAEGLRLQLSTDPAAARVTVGEVDVTTEIRQTRISSAVSAIATNLSVRRNLKERQQAIIAAARRGPRHGCVVEGRDITTVVAPDAEVRLLLTASEAARLARRAMELHGRDDDDALRVTRDEVLRRDADDATVSDFESAADGVLRLDSSGWDLERTVQAVLSAVAEFEARSTGGVDPDTARPAGVAAVHG